MKLKLFLLAVLAGSVALAVTAFPLSTEWPGPEIETVDVNIVYDHAPGGSGTTTFEMQITDWKVGNAPIAKGSVQLQLMNEYGVCICDWTYEYSSLEEPPTEIIRKRLSGAELAWTEAVICFDLEDEDDWGCTYVSGPWLKW